MLAIVVGCIAFVVACGACVEVISHAMCVVLFVFNVFGLVLLLMRCCVCIYIYYTQVTTHIIQHDLHHYSTVYVTLYQDVCLVPLFLPSVPHVM